MLFDVQTESDQQDSPRDDVPANRFKECIARLMRENDVPAE